MAAEIITGIPLIELSAEFIVKSHNLSGDRAAEVQEICKKQMLSFVYHKADQEQNINDVDDSIIRDAVAGYINAYSNFVPFVGRVLHYEHFYPRLADKKYCSSYTNEYEYHQDTFDMFLEYTEDNSDLRKALKMAGTISNYADCFTTVLQDDKYKEVVDEIRAARAAALDDIPQAYFELPEHVLILDILYRRKLAAAVEKYHIRDRFPTNKPAGFPDLYYPDNVEFTRELQKYADIDWENKEGTLFDQALIEAREAAKQKFDLQMFAEEPVKKDLPQVTSKKAENVLYPLDKVNSSEGDIWSLLEEDTGGQLTFAMESSSDKKRGLQLDLTYSINFESLEEDKALHISKRLEPFDKRVYISAAALHNAGNEYITIKQIHKAMGNTSNPSHSQTEKINNSITKMLAARITIDNASEAAAYKNYPHFRYDGALLPGERLSVIVNGKTADAAIKLYREPPLISFARERKQISTITIKALASPINKTDKNISIEDYLIVRIERAKNKKQEKILIDTLCKNAGITDYKKKKGRYKEIFSRLLKHYQEHGLVKDFSVNDTDIMIYFAPKNR